MQDKFVQRFFLIALLFVVGVVVFYILRPFLTPLALAAIFAVVLQPIYQRALAELKGARGSAALMTLLLFVLLILVPLSFIGDQLFLESERLYSSLSSGAWQERVDAFIVEQGPRLDAYVPNASERLIEASAQIDVYARAVATWLIQHLGAAFTGVSSFILALFVFFLTLYYLLRDGDALCRYLVRLSPLSDAHDERILARLSLVVNSIVRGQLLLALIQGVFVGAGLFLFGVPNAIIWTLVAMVAAIIPPLGTAVVTIPAAIFLFMTGATGAAIGILVWAVVAGTIDNIIGPRLMSRGTKQNPLIMMVSVLGGIAFFGPVGIFLGPLAVSFFLTLLALHTESPRDDA